MAADETKAGRNDGKITGTNAIMEYKPLESNDWLNCVGDEITNLSGGVYNVRIKAAQTNFASAIIEVTVNTLKPISNTPYTVNDITTSTGIAVVNVTKNSDGKNGILILLSYADNGKLIDVKFQNVALEYEATQDITFNINLDGAAFVKAFMWESMLNVQPISKVKTKNL